MYRWMKDLYGNECVSWCTVLRYYTGIRKGCERMIDTPKPIQGQVVINMKSNAAVDNLVRRISESVSTRLRKRCQWVIKSFFLRMWLKMKLHVTTSNMRKMDEYGTAISYLVPPWEQENDAQVFLLEEWPITFRVYVRWRYGKCKHILYYLIQSRNDNQG